MKTSKIPVCEPYLTGRERSYLLKAFNSGWISSAGTYIQDFEQEFSRYCGTKYGITTTSGTSALHLALTAAGTKPGDEIILPNFTMVATLFAILYCQAKPILVDVEPDTGNINPQLVEAKISSKTKIIIPVHIYGHPADMSPLLTLARRYRLTIIEDAAEAHGAEYKGKKCGGLGQMGCFSFYANKIVTTGEGGMVVTNNYMLARKCRYYKNLCFPLGGQRSYLHHDLGFNYRMTNLQGAIGLAQTESINSLVDIRRSHARIYNSLLNNLPGIKLPTEKAYAKNVYWMYGIIIDQKAFGLSRNQLQNRLAKRGIDTRVFFQPLDRQPLWKKYRLGENENFPVSHYLARNGLLLPSGTGLTKKQITYICDEIKKAAR